MTKPSEIFDTPEATGFSRVGDHKKPLRICNKTGVHTCRLGSIHLNEREALILNNYLTTTAQRVRVETIEEILNKVKAMSWDSNNENSDAIRSLKELYDHLSTLNK